jgi:midasin (ATPase involved in ribosome maturation)
MISYQDISAVVDSYIKQYCVSDEYEAERVESEFRGFIKGLSFSGQIDSEVSETLIDKFLLSTGAF